MVSIRDKQNYDLARRMPADVLLMAALDQAANSLLSEAALRQMAGAYNEAADVAMMRRTYHAAHPDADQCKDVYSDSLIN